MTDTSFADMTQGSVAGYGGGANQTGARAYNDRLILSLLRREGGLSKAELARRTSLSPQTLGLIVKRLQKDRLLIADEPVRGKTGQPSVPYLLNKDAVFAFGLKIGRRSVALTMSDFLGDVRAQTEQNYQYPTPEGVLEFVSREAGAMIAQMPEAYRKRIIGAGIAMPFDLWSWGEALGAPDGALDGWRSFPIEEAISDVLQGQRVILTNDATAACGAELLLGGSEAPQDFCTLYIGWFVGGGIVLDGKLHTGRTGNAGALGSMLVQGPKGPEPLLQRASLMALERLAGTNVPIDGMDGPFWRSAAVETWLGDAAEAIAYAAVNAAAVIDFAALKIDGSFPDRVRAALTIRAQAAYAQLDTRGLSPLAIEEGSVGPNARSVGAAILPILSNFSRDSDVLLKRVKN